MLAQHAAKLADYTWTTLLFDEAHALKNPATQRWKAARGLRAEACVALTGTPVENHVGELHALFDIVEPGMLGSRTTFRRMIAVPMARGERRPAALLRRIVRPMILRRSKAEVLTELPPKTEMVRLVAASTEHRAFYEAVRQRAISRMQDARAITQIGRGKAHIEILAEITRLRRAAIDPRLVGGPTAPHGSKLDVLVHVVRELREEGHRALIFSQFLEVLDFASQRLEADDVRCLRMDGTMSATARTTVIDAFQRGEGDVLLASLKAGGIGVNLTAADFVIHLDPWWNPAVEDQATDRTHRYGQTRPVTVLRLCTENTVEEKVLAMHEGKRRLYQDVIGESDGGGTLEQWAELIG
jgi:SNF2 family DNA or RNA helicase